MFQFLGNIEVDQAKGIDVVKDGIRKLKVMAHIIIFKIIILYTLFQNFISYTQVQISPIDFFFPFPSPVADFIRHICKFETMFWFMLLFLLYF